MTNGGPAFAPFGAPDPSDDTKAVYGMTLRDWFAGQALTLLAGRSWDHLAPTHNLHEVWAAEAYHIADAMLAERSK